MHTSIEIEKLKSQFGIIEDNSEKEIFNRVLMELVELKTQIDLVKLENSSSKKQIQKMDQEFQTLKKDREYWQNQVILLRKEIKKQIKHVFMAFVVCCSVLIAGTVWIIFS